MKPMLTNSPLKKGKIKEEELKEHKKTEDQAEEREEREDDGVYCGEEEEDDYGEECLRELQKKEELDTVATGNMVRSTQLLQETDNVRHSYVQYFPPVQPEVMACGINPHVYSHFPPQHYPVQPEVRACGINSHVYTHYIPQQYPVQPYVRAWKINSNVNLHHYPPQQYPMQPYVSAQGINSEGNLHQYGQNEEDAYQYMRNMESQLTQQLYGRDNVRNSYVQYFRPVQPDVRAWGINPHVYSHFPPQHYPVQPEVIACGINSHVYTHYTPQQYPVQPYVRAWRSNSHANLNYYPPQQYPVLPDVGAWGIFNSHITHPLGARLYGNLHHYPQWWYAETEGREVPYFTPELPANRRLPIKTPPELKYVVEIKKKRQKQDEEDLYDLPNVLSSSAVEMSMEQYRVPRRYHHSRRTLDKVKKVLTFSDSE